MQGTNGDISGIAVSEFGNRFSERESAIAGRESHQGKLRCIEMIWLYLPRCAGKVDQIEMMSRQCDCHRMHLEFRYKITQTMVAGRRVRATKIVMPFRLDGNVDHLLLGTEAHVAAAMRPDKPPP